jgi:uncharacterized protein (TIGR03437 family)
MAGVSVTINGLTAPLLYVAPTLLNIQVPYELPTDIPLTVVVDNNGRTVTSSLTLAAAAPGIFTDSNFAPIPNAGGAPGDVLTMYATGAGAIIPQMASGNAPSATADITALPHPQQPVTVTVGGLNARVQTAVVPWGLAGVVQITYQVPEGLPVGTNALIVQIGNVSSAAANLTITR